MLATRNTYSNDVRNFHRSDSRSLRSYLEFLAFGFVFAFCLFFFFVFSDWLCESVEFHVADTGNSHGLSHRSPLRNHGMGHASAL